MIVPSRPIPFDGMMFRVSTVVNGGDRGRTRGRRAQMEKIHRREHREESARRSAQMGKIDHEGHEGAGKMNHE